MAAEKRLPLKRLECPNCGSPIEQFDAGTQAIVCSKCSSHVAIGAETLSLLSKGGKTPRSPFPIQMGDLATIGDVEFMVLGRVVYRGWDDEDKWTWDEWLLGGSDGRMIWLSHDENGFGIYQKLRFRAPFDARKDRRLELGLEDGKAVYIHERYPAEIIGAEGELTWQAKRGERLFVAEGAGGGKRYSIQQTDQELEIYEGRIITEEAVAKAFGNAVWLKKLSAMKRRKATAGAIGVMCILFAVLAMVFAVMVSGSGEELEPRFMTLSGSQPSSTFVVDLNQTKRPAIIGVSLRSGALPENSYADVDVNVTAPDGSIHYLFTQELWHETGSDEDGFWRETHYQHSEMFVPYQAGDHKIELVFEPTASVPAVDLAVVVRRNHIMPAWYVIYAVGTGLIGGLLLVYSAARATAKG